MKILATPPFQNKLKKLHANQKSVVDKAVQDIIAQPLIGELKIGDLAGVRVYKFRVIDQRFLLAYMYQAETETIFLIGLGYHENFYRDLKRYPAA